MRQRRVETSQAPDRWDGTVEVRDGIDSPVAAPGWLARLARRVRRLARLVYQLLTES